MRAFLALLLMLLLPLQGWAAVGMQVRMDSSALQHGAMPADCPMLQQHDTAQASDAHADNTHAADAHRTTPDSCQSCQLCMPLLAAVPFQLSSTHLPTWLPRSTLVQRFRTVCLPGLLEPPIAA